MTSRLLAALAVAALGLPVGLLPASADEPDVVPPTLLLPNLTVAEGLRGNAAIVVNVGLSAPNPYDHAVTVGVTDFSAVPLPDGSGTYGTATPGADYVAFAPFHLSFAPGQQVARFTVRVIGDAVVEPSEEVDVRFDDTVFTVGDNDIDLVIGNDDGAGRTKRPLLLPPNQTMPEPDSGCFAYRVSVPVSKPVRVPSTVDAVDFTTVPVPPPGSGLYGTATPGLDYVAFGSRTLRYKVGSRTAQLPVTLCGDTDPEPSEQVDVRFDNTTTIAVQDNDIDLWLSDND